MAITHFSLRVTKLPTFRAQMNMEGWKEREIEMINSDDSLVFEFEKSEKKVRLTVPHDGKLNVIGNANVIHKIAKQMGISDIVYTEKQVNWFKKNNELTEICSISEEKISHNTDTEDSDDGRSRSSTLKLSELLPSYLTHSFYLTLIEKFGETMANDIIQVAKIIQARISTNLNAGSGSIGSGGDNNPITTEEPKVQKTISIDESIEEKIEEWTFDKIFMGIIKVLFFIIAIPLFIIGTVRLVTTLYYMISWGISMPKALLLPLIMILIPYFAYRIFYRKSRRPVSK